jgi:nicotinate dehydrogenase subunit B
VAPLLGRASPWRTAHLRDPLGPQIQFASESFIDEIAAAVSADPVAFRLRYLKEPRDIAVVRAAAERAGWQPHSSARPDRTGDKLAGRASPTPSARVPSSRSSPRSRSTAAPARSSAQTHRRP